LGWLPAPFKTYLKRAAIVIPPRWRLSRTFWQTYAFLQESQKWSRDHLLNYQLLRLQDLLRYAGANVPYYGQLFNEHGIDAGKIRSLDDLKRIPPLDKTTVRNNLDVLISARAHPSGLISVKTSGTSGKALNFYEEKSTGEREWAFICHQWDRVGYKPGDFRAELRTYFKAKRGYIWDHWRRALRILPDIHTKEQAKTIVDLLERSQIKFLHGYPTAVASLALAIKHHGIATKYQPKAALLASESVYEWQRELIAEVFRCRIYAHYGITEKVMLAGECEGSRNYHTVPQYGVSEIDPRTGELIATGFLNYVMPLIRYRTGDFVKLSENQTCENCGRNYIPLIESIEGRLADTIRTPGGRLISPAAMTYQFSSLKTIRDAQIRQHTLDQISIAVAKWPERTDEEYEAETKSLAASVAKLVGEGVSVTISHEPELRRTEAGKFRWIISEPGQSYLRDILKQ